MNERSFFYFALLPATLLLMHGNLLAEKPRDLNQPALRQQTNPADAPAQGAFGFLPPVRQSFLHLNGYSIHFDKRPAPGKSVNDHLFGLGGSVEFDTHGPLIWGIAGDVFWDSREEVSAVLGPSCHYPFNDHVSVGGAAFLMYKTAFQRDYGFPILPVPLPFAEIGTERIRLRTYYIPPVRRPTDHQVVFQLRIPL